MLVSNIVGIGKYIRQHIWHHVSIGISIGIINPQLYDCVVLQSRDSALELCTTAAAPRSKKFYSANMTATTNISNNSSLY